jgi:hypothetical protein
MLRLYGSPGQDVIYAAEKRNGNNFRKVTERSGNLIENKGRLLKTLALSWNVYENK